MLEYITILFFEIYKILFLLIPVLVSVAMIVWLDRRVWAFVQKRRGPNVVGPFGLFQPIADGIKLLTKDQNDIDTKVFMLQAIEDFCSEHAISSAHLTFLNEKELNTLQNKKWLIRTDQQFHWFNDNYNDFNDFLSDLSSRKRKNIKKIFLW